MEAIQANKAVTMRYVMRSHFPDGTGKERPPETHEFIFGVVCQAPALENALEGKKTGDRVGVNIPPEEIYGSHDPDLIREIPKKGLVKQRLKEGQLYRQMKKGCLVSFKVLKVEAENVLVDFNKPMAGISVSMDLEILDVREASPEEIEAAREARFKKSIGCG